MMSNFGEREVMDMSKPVEHSRARRRVDARKVWSIILSVCLPPLGAYLVWNARWKKRQKGWLSAMAAVCFVLMVGAMLWPGESKEGGIEYVTRKPEVEVYGPELPIANVSGYIAPVSQSVLAKDEDENVTYVYATATGKCYHLSGCKYAYESAQKLTPYSAHFMGYTVCPDCNPPAYVAGSMN